MVIVTAAIVGAAVWIGYCIGRVREREARTGVDPKWVQRVETFLRALITPPDDLADVSEMTVLPEEKRKAATGLLHDAPGAPARREALRRRGY